MNLLLVLPILIPLITATGMLVTWRSPRLQRVLNVVGSSGLLAAAIVLLTVVVRHGVQAVQLGGWPAPFGITFVADLLSAILVLLAGVLGLAVSIYSRGSIDIRREAFGYWPLYQVLLMGVCGAFLTGDVFNLYVWFEVMLIASFVLLTLGCERAQIEGAVKYVTLNLLSSAIFLAATGLLYGMVGTLNMADLAVHLRNPASPALVTTIALLFLVSFGIKAAVFPLFFWLPASYHTAPIAVTAIFAGLLTKVGVYGMIRMFTLVFVNDAEFIHSILLVMAAFTMITGVLGAAAQTDFRRLLSFHIVSQIGYALLGLGLFTPLALAGTIFFLFHVSLAKAALFLASGIVYRVSGTYDLKQLGGLARQTPFLAGLFLVPALSLAGIPPLSGFWAKFALVTAGLEERHYFLVAVALGVSVLTLFSMTKIWAEVFWKDRPTSKEGAASNPAQRVGPEDDVGGEAGSESPIAAGAARPTRLRPSLVWPTLLLGSLSLVMGLLAQPVFAVALRAAEQLLAPEAYIRAVLGGS